MNIARITGIILFAIGVYLFTVLDKYDLGFFGGFTSGVTTVFGLGLIIIGKFKLWQNNFWN